MNYKRIYYEIIFNRLINNLDDTVYTESHHIQMRCLGGTDDKSNLVKLKPREHYICHLLLTKIYKRGTLSYYKAIHAFFMMLMSNKDGGNSKRKQEKINSRLYEKLKIEYRKSVSIHQSGKSNSQYGTKWINNGCIDKKIRKDENLPDGFKDGRIKKEKVKKRTFKVPKEKKEKPKKEKPKKDNSSVIKQYTEYYEIYKEVGFKEFVKITNYDKSLPNLVSMFKKYVKEFVPQNGRKRGI